MSQEIFNGLGRVEVSNKLSNKKFQVPFIRGRIATGLSRALELFGLQPIYRANDKDGERQDVYLERFTREKSTGWF